MKRSIILITSIFGVAVLLLTSLGCSQNGLTKEQQARQDAHDARKARHGD